MTSALACRLLWLLVRPGLAAQPRRPEILRLATATAIYGGGGNFLRLAMAYELYGGLRRQLGGLLEPGVEARPPEPGSHTGQAHCSE